MLTFFGAQNTYIELLKYLCVANKTHQEPMGFHEPKWPLLESTKMFKVGSEFDPPMIPKGSPREPKFQNESGVDPLKIHDGSEWTRLRQSRQGRTPGGFPVGPNWGQQGSRVDPRKNQNGPSMGPFRSRELTNNAIWSHNPMGLCGT